MTTPVEIIAAFDDAIRKAWGDHLARPWPHPQDKVTADRWIRAGASVELCRGVFERIMETRKERRLSIPGTLSYFDNPVRDAIATASAPVEESPEMSRWRARVQGWKRNPRLWNEDMWGPAPNQSGSRVPAQILQTV